MRVAFVITGLEAGGAEMMLYKLLERSGQLRRGWVIALRCGGEMVPRFRSLGVSVDCLGMKPGRPDPLAIWRLARMLQHDRPNVVSTWMYHADLIGGLAARLVGVPVVWNIRHSNLDADKTKSTTRLVVRACSTLSSFVPSGVISCSETARNIHLKVGYRKNDFSVIPNGFNLDRFFPSHEARIAVRRELCLGETTPLIGLIARFDPQKNHLGFLEAAKQVNRRQPDVHFLMAGTGVSRENDTLRSAIDTLGLNDVVSLLGHRNDIPRLMASLDILASSSDGEAFPNVIGEAMACEVPCVVTDVGDSAYVVGNTGIVVKQGDMTGLADGITQLLEMPESERESLGQRARQRVAENFDIGSVVQQYEALYAEIAGMGYTAGSKES